MDWKELFDETRLDRGYNYYIEDRVYDILLTDNTITSKVEGSKSNIYEVKIEYDKDNIKSLYCTCPYAYADFNCKHMVATLYKKEEITSNKEKTISDENYDNTIHFNEILKNLDEIKLKRYIYDEFKDDEEFIEKFVNKFQIEFTPEDLDNYENILNNIFNIDLVELYNENGFYQESPFQRYLENFINNKINLLYKNREYDYVLQLLYMIYSNISEKISVEDYLNVDSILKSCNYYMQKVIDESDNIQKDEIFNYMISNIKYEYSPIVSNYLIQLCTKNYNTKEYLQQINEVLDILISDKTKKNETLVLQKYELMKKMNYPQKQTKQFLMDNKSYPEILKILIKEEISEKNIDKAIELLNQNLSKNSSLHSLEDTLLLLELYKYNDDKENTIKTLKTVLYEFNIQDLSYIQELKELYEKNEWVTERNELIQFYEDNYSFEFLNKLYVEEELYYELFINLKENCHIDSIEEYRKYIEKNYTPEILKIYYNLVLNDAKSAKNISAYTVIIRYIYTMLTYQDSQTIVKKLLDVLENKYKDRKLFMERLDEIRRNNF